MTSTRHRLAIAALGCLVLSAPASAAPGHDHEAQHEHVEEIVLTPEAIQQYGVQIGTASRQALANAVVAPARVAFNSDAMAHVGSAVKGRVADLRVKLGSNVSRGDILAIVESPELGEAQSDLLLKRAALDAARPGLQLARDAYERARKLAEDGQGIAASEVQKRQVELQTAETAVRAAEAAATAAENKLHLYGMSQDDVVALVESGEIVPQFQVVAPISGQIVEREVTLGELVNPDRDALMIIADLSTVWVIADVPEARLNIVSKGDAARVTVAAAAKPLEGTITYIAPALDPATRCAKVRVEVHDETSLLKPGMFAQVALHPSANRSTAVLAIPEAAVQTIEGGPKVFVPVEGEPNTFALRPVTIGSPTAGMVQVFTGLKEGEPLVTAGSFILKAELGKSGAAHEH